MQADFRGVQGKLSNSAGSGMRKEVTAPRRPGRAGKGITSLESRIRGADSPVEPEPRPRAGHYL